MSQGQAIARGREIIARDRIDDRDLAEKLRAECDAEMDRLRRATASLTDARVRGIVTATNSELESDGRVLDGIRGGLQSARAVDKLAATGVNSPEKASWPG